MDEQNQDTISRRNLRRSALGKECIFSVARPRPQDQDLRFGSRPGPKAHDRFIHVDPAMYRTGSNSTGGNVDNISNNNNNGQQASKERSAGPSWRQNHPDAYGEDARNGGFHGCWPDTLPPLHHHHLPAASIPSATAAPITRPPSQAASLTLDRDVDMAFQHAERASSSGQSEAHLSSVSDEGWYWNNVPDFSDNAYSGSSADIYRAVSDDFALLVSRGGIPPPHEEGHGGRDKSRQQQQQQHAPAPGRLRGHDVVVGGGVSFLFRLLLHRVLLRAAAHAEPVRPQHVEGGPAAGRPGRRRLPDPVRVLHDLPQLHGPVGAAHHGLRALPVAAAVRAAADPQHRAARPPAAEPAGPAAAAAPRLVVVDASVAIDIARPLRRHQDRGLRGRERGREGGHRRAPAEGPGGRSDGLHRRPPRAASAHGHAGSGGKAGLDDGEAEAARPGVWLTGNMSTGWGSVTGADPDMRTTARQLCFRSCIAHNAAPVASHTWAPICQKGTLGWKPCRMSGGYDRRDLR
ncbi:hypothetical protein CH63R_06538 [Colletotrichum higginsianum IMI 349063]|uniref:Uncharacterized protein n=1 Tax=Colletotrichum higginsianum (strain IMI 349063) TaxID=759273 RepID=A0A1B7YFL4_COLHI|nr:hypothetical protein CH63R_06538 [Colletotrichum higginsianum IMI 349063]OBR10846.1 hypothetical protein CH63R_06538 [Colletotrichum higginsianum IMI 349063]